MGFDARYFGDALSRAFSRFGNTMQESELRKQAQEYEMQKAKELLLLKQTDPLYMSQVLLNQERIKKLGRDTGKGKASSSNPGGYDYSGLKRR